MERFAARRDPVLVSTTVIEVGVDVRNATVMVIEHAERFGLAQLHQLRGRVGRGAAPRPACCSTRGPSAGARARLEMMRETEDGFRIAEEDLRLRGEGEVLGTRQSGRPASGSPSLETDRRPARGRPRRRPAGGRARPGARRPRGRALRVLLYLFERDAAIRLLGAG